MSDLTSTDMFIILILVGIILILLGIIGILDYVSKRKKKEEWEEKYQSVMVEENSEENIVDTPEDELIGSEILTVDVPSTSSNKVEKIKYVVEDEELEKTKAKLELKELKEELCRQEEARKQEEVVVVATVDEINNPNTTVIVSEENKPIVEAVEEEKEIINTEKPEVSQIANAINEQLVKEERDEREANLPKMNEVQEDLNEILEISFQDKIFEHEDAQEEKAIISVEQINEMSDEVLDNNEAHQVTYADEGNEPISIEELETLYNTKEMKVIKLADFETIASDKKENVIAESDIKRLEDLPPIAMERKFKSSPFISPVYGISETKENLELEQTANLDKLNEEIKKTNEFLKTLKELQKNLD